LILSSSYLRALQTAELVAKRFRQVEYLVQDQQLAPGFGLSELAQILADYSKAQRIMLVGHEPDFSLTVAEIIGGGRLLFKKAGLARVDLWGRDPLQGELAWFASPKLFGIQ
jgi:phosphohistidine phosphatase